MPEIPFDLHTHTLFSPDGESSAAEMAERAVQLGIKRLAITDHAEVNEFGSGGFDYEKALKGSSEEIPALRERYAGKLDLLYGIELGQPVHDPDTAGRILREYPFDFVIGSCHMVRGYEDFYFLDYTEEDTEKLLDMYFRELQEMAERGGFDVMGHITYPLRYIEGEHGIRVNMEKYREAIDEIFRTLIKNGAGIEINTSGLRQKIGRLLPDAGYVKRFRELGGEILTIGSDAHCAADLGKNIADGIAAAKAAGFDRVACFRNRKPEFIHI